MVVSVRAILYVIVQSVGAIAGAGILKGLTNDGDVCTPTPNPALDLSLGQVFGIELMITFVLVLTVFATCDSVRPALGGSGPLAIGLSITMCHLWAVRIIASSAGSCQEHWMFRTLHMFSLLRLFT